MPSVRNALPATLLRIVSTVNSRVLAATSGLISGIGRDGMPLLPLVRDELLTFLTQRHILARFLRQPLAVVRVEDHLSHHPPDHFGPEVVFAVEFLHPVHQLGFV